jgi:hypothetical protein
MAMSVREHRAVPNGAGYSRVLVGYVCRDIQFTVRNSCPPIVPQGVIEDSLKNATKVNFNTVNVCSSKFTQINFKMFGDTQEFLKYKIYRTPNSTSVLNYSNTITIDRKNQVDTLHCRITFDSIKGESQEIFELEAYYCTNIGIKISQFYTLVVNLKQCSYTFNTVACDSYYWAAKNKTYTTSNNTDTVKLINAAGCDSIVTLNLTIYQNPNPAIIKTGNVLSTQLYNIYQWLYNGSNISGAVQQSYTAASNGSYQVEVTDANNCKGISASLNVIVSSLNEVDKDCFNIYPNPTEKLLYIETNEPEEWNAVISDSKGAQIKQIQFQKSTQLDINNYAPGVYYIQLTSKEEVLNYKFIKK